MSTEMPPILVEVPLGTRLNSVEPEFYSKGHIYAAEDVLRRQVLVLAQRMKHVQTAIEDPDICGEPISLASLFESCNLQLRRGRTGSFKVTRLAPSEAPSFVDERAKRFGRVVIAATNASKWELCSRSAPPRDG